jgi:hypothetical protein
MTTVTGMPKQFTQVKQQSVMAQIYQDQPNTQTK